MPTKKFTPLLTSPLRQQIEVEVYASGDSIAVDTAPQIGGIDSAIIQDLEELLERIDMPHLGTQDPPPTPTDVPSILKRISDIERELKTFQAESAALRQLLRKMH